MLRRDDKIIFKEVVLKYLQSIEIRGNLTQGTLEEKKSKHIVPDSWD